PYNVLGSQQDNTSISIASMSNRGSITRADWDAVGGGEAGYISANSADPNIVYAGEYFGILTRFDRRTAQAQNIMVWPDDTDGHAADDVKYRFNWTQPIHSSYHDAKVLYYTGNHVFKSTNEGMKWEIISPDMTRNDKSKQKFSGGPITGENISIETYGVVFSFAESRLQKDLLWAGTDDGLVHVTRDGGKAWENVTPKNLPEGIVSIIDASPHDTGSAFLALDRHKFDDYKPYIYKTHDGGKTWTRINDGIPDVTFVRTVREDPAKKGLLYAGTETGIYVSFDDGAHWQSLQLNLPTTPIHDLVVKDDDLVIATHGRSFWILDDLSPLRQMSAEIAKSDASLFKPETAWHIRHGGGAGAAFAGENPPDGAILYFYLKADQKDEVSLEILDKNDKVIRKYSSVEKQPQGRVRERGGRGDNPDLLPNKAGLHRWVWNLRYQLPELVQGAIYDMGMAPGPMAVPGKYSVRFNVAGKSYSQPLEVKLDPRVTTSQADLEKQLEHSIKVRDLLGTTHATVMAMRDMREQLTALKKRLAGDESSKGITSAADAIEKKMAPAEAELIEVRAKASQDMCNYPTKLNSKLAYLTDIVESADHLPTQQVYEYTAEMETKMNAQIAIWKEIVSKDVAALNEQIKSNNVPGVSVKK
ncbi:MAG: glycosyl hydrolase, partial [Acidobacteria bacterium]|nr:glycosyl hydrolase [Acidobacteriota bacterium]